MNTNSMKSPSKIGEKPRTTKSTSTRPPIKLKPVTMFADGACKGNPGRIGWGALLVNVDGKEKELFGGEPSGTNNRAELIAVIEGLNWLAHAYIVTVFTDSSYVVKGMREWIHDWKANGWKTAKHQPVKNFELWQALDAAQSRHIVHWRWVPGHNGNPGNERADALANRGVESVSKWSAVRKWGEK